MYLQGEIIMEKAYDHKYLIEQLRVEGLEISEEAARSLMEVIFHWLKESAIKSENMFDDLAIPLLNRLQKDMDKKIDNINKGD